MRYRLKTEDERIDSIDPAAPIDLKIQSLANLNETIDELFAELEKQGDPELLESLCPYFGVVWPSARGLAGHLAQQGASSLAGRTLLEVGCGLALPSLVAARLGAEVVATDFHPDIEGFLGRNRELNGVGLEYVRWDWRATASPLGKFDWVVGSDILYERQHPGPVARMLADHVAPGGKIVLADPGRPYLQPFADEMKGLGFGCSVLTRSVADGPVPARRDVFVLELSRS